MSNVLNPETESITLNTELETPTLEPATEQEQPSYESTSNPETAATTEAIAPAALDADATNRTRSRSHRRSAETLHQRDRPPSLPAAR